MNIVFVILHYKTHEDTIQCVESIVDKIDTDDYKIVIVDNASNNGSNEELVQHYRMHDRITIIQNNSNLGMARGLNVGIRYALEHLNPRFIAAINNDTCLLDSDFYKVLNRKFEQYHFAVLGPMIITRDGYCNVNPIRNTVRGRDEIKKSIARYQKLIRLCNLNLIGLYKFLSSIKKKKAIDKTCHLEDRLDFKLHGSFWVFSSTYFEYFDGLDDSTFLYGEEDILYLHIIKNGLHTLYTPDIKIFHKEDSSTNKVYATKKEKVKFISENAIKSLNIYLALLDKYD